MSKICSCGDQMDKNAEMCNLCRADEGLFRPPPAGETSLDLLEELNRTLAAAWDRRDLPASAVSGDLVRRVYKHLREHGRA